MDRETAPQRPRLRPNRDEYFAAMLRLVAVRSTCVRRAVGAILVDADGRILSTGHNGVPPKFPHCTETPCPGAKDPSGDTRHCLAIHAEMNALIQCWRRDLAHTLYVSTSPCFNCAKAIATTPIKRIVCLELYNDLLGLEVIKFRKIELLVLKPNGSRSGNCPLCGVFRQRLERDHILPRHKGGSNESNNIQYICANCHQDKTCIELRACTLNKPKATHPPWNKGKHTSSSTAAKISAAHAAGRYPSPKGRPGLKGAANPRYGKPISSSTAAKISAAHAAGRYRKPDAFVDIPKAK